MLRVRNPSVAQGAKMEKLRPLNKKAYGSIGHIAESRLGPGDHSVPLGQSDMCIGRSKRKDKRIWIQTKLDGSCCAVAKINGEIIPLVRAGYIANTSPFIQHTYFYDWVLSNVDIFNQLLSEGERVVGEWLAQAHGTRYDLSGKTPFPFFDIMTGNERIDFTTFLTRLLNLRASLPDDRKYLVDKPSTIAGPMAPEEALQRLNHYGAEVPEGVMYRVENVATNRVEFLAKWVRADKIDGKYLPEITGSEPIWNWKPNA